MNDHIEPADAARALDEIDRRREQVIRRQVFPHWFWWGYALLIIASSTAVQSSNGVVIAVGVAVFVVGSRFLDAPVQRAARAATPRRHLAGQGYARRVLAGVAAFVAVLVGAAVATGLSLKAADVPYPGVFATVVAAVLFAVAGPILVRYEADVLVRRSGGRG